MDKKLREQIWGKKEYTKYVKQLYFKNITEDDVPEEYLEEVKKCVALCQQYYGDITKKRTYTNNAESPLGFDVREEE